MVASGWDGEAVATQWKIATQTKLEIVLVMVGLMACKRCIPHGDGSVMRIMLLGGKSEPNILALL